jgi:hypothetical protein
MAVQLMLHFVLQCSMNEVWPASALLVKPGIEKIWNKLRRNVAQRKFQQDAPAVRLRRERI